MYTLLAELTDFSHDVSLRDMCYPRLTSLIYRDADLYLAVFFLSDVLRRVRNS